MKTIILDTNALMAIGQFKIDVFMELERVCDFKYGVKVLDKTVDELEKIINEQRGKYQERAKLALDIIKKKKIKKIRTKDIYATSVAKRILPTTKGLPARRVPPRQTVDDILVMLAKKGMIVVTQDKELKGRIKEVGGKLMTIRQKKKIVFI